MTRSSRNRARALQQQVESAAAGERRYRALFEQNLDAVLLTTAEGRILAANPIACQLFGRAEAELITLGWGDLVDLTDPRAAGAADSQARTGHFQGTLRCRRRDDTPFRVEMSSIAFAEAGAGGARVSTILRDVEARTRAEDARFADQAAVALENARLFGEMQQAYAKLSRTQETLVQDQKMDAIGRLAGGVAHDFNNLLTVILGYADLLRKRLAADHPAVRQVDLIRTTAERAVSLIRQLLAFSRKQVLQSQNLDLNRVVANLATMLHRLIGEDVAVHVTLEASPALVVADPGQLEQVIINLAVNARDAMPTGGLLTIATGNVGADDPARPPDLPPGAFVTLVVSDTGHGIDPGTRAHLFEPFFTTKSPGKGTGLGLATVYGIVTQSGGRIDVESAPGHGTAFRIYMPLGRDSTEAVESAPRMPARGGAETILVVEDEDEVRGLAQEVLERAGYTVLPACHAGEAFTVAEQHAGPIHLMVTDVVMPGMSGRVLAESLVPLRRGMKVLYVSGYTDDAIVRHGVGDESVAFLQKPFAPSVLVRKVREVLDTA